MKINYFYENFAIVSICLQIIFFKILSLNGVLDLSKNESTQELTQNFSRVIFGKLSLMTIFRFFPIFLEHGLKENFV